ncbi:unnamed protein product [Haemonchus placei]|uniref:TIP41-like protein n=1 Tax=Haemonchus placei TaxID=6290 RepID=A0A0N4WLT3_HAEPC|nr:unnamed protein product [Haemonchus placei]
MTREFHIKGYLMESIIYGKPTLHRVITLKALITNFKYFTKEVKYYDDPYIEYEESVTAADLIKGSTDQMAMDASNLQDPNDKTKTDYDNAKNKGIRKISSL